MAQRERQVQVETAAYRRDEETTSQAYLASSHHVSCPPAGVAWGSAVIAGAFGWAQSSRQQATVVASQRLRPGQVRPRQRGR